MAERRRHPRYTRYKAKNLRLLIDSAAGTPKALEARLVDAGEGGLGVEAPEPVQVGTAVSVAGEIHDDRGRLTLERRARVVSCFPARGAFRVGLSFLDLGYWNPFFRDEEARARTSPASTALFIDYYELLQVSPRAEGETIHRVYRHMAAKYHPDNQATGNAERFKLLHKAHEVLSDPEQRELYDREYQFRAGLRRRTFDQNSAARSIKTEPSKRQALLGALYQRSLYASENPGLGLRELEEILGCGREVFEFALWFLSEKRFIARSDSGRYTITHMGVDEAETHRGPGPAERLMLTTGGLAN